MPVMRIEDDVGTGMTLYGNRVENVKDKFHYVNERVAILKAGGVGMRIEGIGRCVSDNIFYITLSREEAKEIFEK